MRDRIVQLSFEERGGVYLATLAGDVDASNADELVMAIAERLPATAGALVLDLTEVGYLDSSGIHLVFELASRLGARRQLLHGVVPHGAPTRRVLELCNVGAVVPLSANVADALAAIERQPGR